MTKTLVEAEFLLTSTENTLETKILAERIFQALGDYFNRTFSYQSDEVKQSKRKKVKTIYGNMENK